MPSVVEYFVQPVRNVIGWMEFIALEETDKFQARMAFEEED